MPTTLSVVCFNCISSALIWREPRDPDMVIIRQWVKTVNHVLVITFKYCSIFTAEAEARSAKCSIATLSRPSVRLSVCLSVCNVDVLWAYCIGWTSWKLITRITSLDLRTSEPQHRQPTPKFGWNSGVVALLSMKPAISLNRGMIGPMLLLMTNRKPHSHFRLVPASTTLDDLERLLRIMFQNTRVFRSPRIFERR